MFELLVVVSLMFFILLYLPRNMHFLVDDGRHPGVHGQTKSE